MSRKLSPRSTPCVFLGYPFNHRGYRCLALDTNKIIISRHVVFDESNFPFQTFHHATATAYDFLESNAFQPAHLFRNNGSHHNTTQLPPANVPSPRAHSAESSGSSEIHCAGTYSSNAPQPSHSMRTRSQHGIFKPKIPPNLSVSHVEPSPLPKSHIQALQDHNWRKAMHDEFRP